MELVEKPLAYWERNSYMLGITSSETDLYDLTNNFFDRIAKIEGVTVKEKQPLSEAEPGQATIDYDGEQYYIGFYPSDFSLPEVYLRGKYYFSNEEAHLLRNANKAFTIFMKFGKDAKKSFHLQLKLLTAAVPNLLGVMDESAEKMIPIKWVKMTAESKILPGADDLYTVQAISGENEVWLHTHGLCRCGLTELEILKSDKNKYKNHYNLLSTFASFLINEESGFDYKKDFAFIGRLSNGQPICVTYLPWTEGLKKYDKLELGGIEDREENHNTKTGIIFSYLSKEDAENKRVSFVSEYDDYLGDNPMFLLSNKETQRMKSLAVENFDVLKEQSNNPDNKITIKIALPYDGDSFEHIWFDLVKFDGDKFCAKLTQEPYDVKDIHVGEERWFTAKDVTDWAIYTKDFHVTPNTAYLLK